MPPLAVCALALASQAAIPAGRSSSARRFGDRAALATLAGSGGLLAAPFLTLRRLGTTVDPRPGVEPSVLAQHGVYRWSRNPMYLGMTGLLVAHAMFRRSPAALAPAGAFVLWANRRQIPREESALSITFGPKFDRYCLSTPRWVGRPARAHRD